MFSRKYKLIPAEPAMPPLLAVKFHEEKEIPMFRLKALQDIPKHGVKKGDLGGRVSNKHILAQTGSCWVAYDATVFGNVYIKNDAYIGDSAQLACLFDECSIDVLINARVYGNAVVYVYPKYYDYKPVNTVIAGNAQIYGDVWLRSVQRVSDNAKIYGDATLDFTGSVGGNSEIYGEAEIGEKCLISGDSKVSGVVVLSESVILQDSFVQGRGFVASNAVLINERRQVEVSENPPVSEIEVLPVNYNQMEKLETAPSARSSRALQLLDEVLADIACYETDIVKIIQYPVMTDRSIPETRDMIVALKLAKRLTNEPESDDFIEAVADLEKKFLTAESVALKISSTALSLEEKKKTQKASNLLALASNEAASDNERAQAFKQAFKQLEGVIAVPEIAVETFKIKIGLKELES